MLKHLSQMNTGDQFWFPMSVAESVSARFIGEFPEGYSFRIEGELNCEHTHVDHLFEMVN